MWDLGEWQQKTVQSKQWQIWNENTKIVIIWTIIALKYWYNISQEYENPPVYKFRNMTHLITSDKLIKVATTMSNFDSWWLPVTTSCVVDIVLWRPSFHWNLTALSGSLHTSKAQQKVGPACLPKFTISPCYCLSDCFLGAGGICANTFILCVCVVVFLLQTTPICFHNLHQATGDRGSPTGRTINAEGVSRSWHHHVWTYFPSLHMVSLLVSGRNISR